MAMAARVRHIFLLAKTACNSFKAEIAGHISEAKEKACEWIRTSVFNNNIRDKLYYVTIAVVLAANWPFVRKNWMEFSSLGFELGIFIYGSSVLMWKIVRRCGQTLKSFKRESNAVKCNQEKEMVHHEDNLVGVSHNGFDEVAIESENSDDSDEDQNKSTEEQYGENQLPTVYGNEGKTQGPVEQLANYEASRAEVSGNDGKLSLEDPVGCVNCYTDRNELGSLETIIGTSETNTAQAESEANGVTSLETEQYICVGLESMKTAEKELETSASKDMAASIEVTHKAVGIEKNEEITEILLNQNNTAIEDSGPKLEDITGIENLVTTVEGRNAVKALINTAEDTDKAETAVEDRNAIEALTNTAEDTDKVETAVEDTKAIEDTDKVETAVEDTKAIEDIVKVETVVEDIKAIEVLINTDEDSTAADTALVEAPDAIEALRNAAEESNTDDDNANFVEDKDAVHDKLQRRLEEIADEDKLKVYGPPDNLSLLVIYEDPEEYIPPHVQVLDSHGERQLESYARELKEADQTKYLQHQLLMIQYESASDATTSKSSSAGRDSSSRESEWRNSSSMDSDQWRNSTSRDSELYNYCYKNSLQPSLGQRSCSISDETLYEKYNERMHHFDILNYEQLHAVGFPQPPQLLKSRSQRMVSSLRQLSSRRREPGDDQIEQQHHKDELETIYVSQTCLTWEVLHWQYKKIQQRAAFNSKPSPGYDRSAEQFQYFQVLLQRFLENEPYDRGLRSQIYARRRYQLPKLLQVPDVKALIGEEGDRIPAEQATLITASQLAGIIEGSVMTFWDFLKADKEKSSKTLDVLWGQPKPMDSTDLALLKTIKTCLNKKEARLQELKRKRKCLRQKLRSNISLSKEEANEILLGFIDIKLISRVLKMSRINKDHLRWCEEKLNKLVISKGKLHRDYSPVFFPS